MQNDKEASALIDNFVNLHTTHGGAAIIVDRGGYRYQWVGEVRVTATGREDALLHLFESIFEAGMSLGRKRTIDQLRADAAETVAREEAKLNEAHKTIDDARDAITRAEEHLVIRMDKLEQARKLDAAVAAIADRMVAK